MLDGFPAKYCFGKYSIIFLKMTLIVFLFLIKMDYKEKETTLQNKKQEFTSSYTRGYMFVNKHTSAKQDLT